jgi:hypothetical protein
MSGIVIDASWDSKSWEQADAFVAFGTGYDHFLVNTSKDLAEYAQEYFKPMLNVRNNPRGNGDTKESIKYDITNPSGDFTIEYTGLLSAYYMDVGNFPAGAVLSSKAFGMNFFPIDKRFGPPFLARTIHGMGHYTPGAVTHWSEKTANHMAHDGVALEIAMEHFAEFLDQVVIT